MRILIKISIIVLLASPCWGSNVVSLVGGQSYTFTYIDSCTGSATGSDTTLDCSSTLDIQAGDTLVVFSSWYGSGTSSGVAETDSDNAASMQTLLSYGNTKGHIGVVTSATAGSAVTFRQTIDAASTYRTVFVYQFRKTGGTVSQDTYASGTGSDTSPVTGSFSTSPGAVIVAAEFDGNLRTVSSPLIGGSAPDDSIILTTGTPYSAIWYSIEPSSQSSITAAATLNDTGSWVCPVIALKAE